MRNAELKFGISPGQWTTVARKDLYDFLDSPRQIVHSKALRETKEMVNQAEDRDSISRSYFDALIAGDHHRATGAWNNIYEIVKNDLNFCRMVCCLDATVSMEPIWEATKQCIHEMLKRIDDLGEGQFKLMFVACRDYTEHKEWCRPLLEKSSWSKNPQDLSDFVSSIQTGWGMRDWAEAVEHALEFANEEHARDCWDMTSRTRLHSRWGNRRRPTSRPEQLPQTNEQDDGESDRTVVKQTKCPCSHDTYVTTIGRLACDQHDRTNKIVNDRPRSGEQNNRVNSLFF